MKHSIFKGKSTRTKIFTVITTVSVLIVLALNFTLTYFGSTKMVFADMTPEGFYTLTDKMVEACADILDKEDENGNKKKIEVTFCTDPDYLVASADMRLTYYMALAIHNKFKNFEVKTVNVEIDPTAVSMYKTTSRDVIRPSDIIISYGNKYRVVGGASFWTKNRFSYNGEYKMVSILASLTAINQPVAYFVTDHGETYYDVEKPDSDMSIKTAAFYDLLVDRGLTVKTLNISEVDKIPKDCAILIINNPTSDFTSNPEDYDRFDYVSDLEKIDRYLVAEEGALIVNKDYKVTLPKLESFLKEWGISFGNSLVKDTENCLSDVGEFGTSIMGVYDKETIGGAYYEQYSSLSSAPKMIFTNSGYVYCGFDGGDSMNEAGSYNTQKVYSDFIYTSDKSVAYEGPGSTVITAGESKKALAAMTTRTHLDNVTSEKKYSYIFAANSADFFSNEILMNASYANADIMASVIHNISRTDRYASMELGGVSANSPMYGGKQTVSMVLKDKTENVYSPDGKEVIAVNHALSNTAKTMYTIVITVVPVAVAVFGLVVFIKRKYL